MMLLIIDPNTIERLGLISRFESLQWTMAFNTDEGEFQLVCSEDYAGLLSLDNLIENSEEPEHIGVIKRVSVLSSNEKRYLSVEGTMLESEIFKRRVIKNFVLYKNVYPTAALMKIISMAMIHTIETDRSLKDKLEIIVPPDSEIADMERIEYSCNYGNLEEEVFSIIANLNLGIKSRVDHDRKKVVIEFYPGNDLTYGSDNPIIFGTEFGTVIESEYIKDSSQNFNHLLLVGEDNVTAEAEREREPGEPLIEQSIDMASELPWPTYLKEMHDTVEEGNYYRYKKNASPPTGFLGNVEIWEKYAVERTEKDEVQNFISWGPSKPISLEDFERGTGNMWSGVSNNGISGSLVNTGAAIDDANRNPGIESPIELGVIVKKKTDAANLLNEQQEESIVIYPKEEASRQRAKSAKKLKAKKIKAKKTVTNLQTSKAVGKDLLSNMENLILESIEKTKDGFEVKEGEPGYRVITVITYEVKEFLEYVYVNPGESPTNGMIVKGSFRDGDFIVHERFEEIRVPEATYKEALMKRAKEMLETFVIAETVSVVPYTLGAFRYKKDYALGDIVTTKEPKSKIETDLRISQVVRTWDAKSVDLELTLGKNIPKLTARIKKLAKGG